MWLSLLLLNFVLVLYLSEHENGHRHSLFNNNNNNNNNNTTMTYQHVSKNLILNQGCSQKCNNNENIHVDNNKSVHHQEIL